MGDKTSNLLNNDNNKKRNILTNGGVDAIFENFFVT